MTTGERDAGARAQAFATLGALRQKIASLEATWGISAQSEAPPVPELGDAAILQLVLDHGSDFVSIHDPKGDYLYASPASQRLFGWPPEDLLGKNAYVFFHPEDLATIAADHAAHGGAQQSVRYRLRCSSGEYRWVETRSRARVSNHGVEQIICFTRDIQDEETAKSNARAAALVLAEQERATILAGVVSALNHELNNPLMAAMLNLDAVQGAPGEEQSLEAARTAIERIRQVIRETALVFQGNWTEESIVDLAVAAERVVSMLPRERPFRLTTEFSTARVRGAEAVLLQCLYHIAFSHVEGTPRERPDVSLALRVGAFDDHAVFEIASQAKELPNRMRADFTSIRQGLGARWIVPMHLANMLAEQLRGRIENTSGPDGLLTRLELPSAALDATPSPPATHA